MTLVQSDYTSVVQRADALGVPTPTGLAILPDNFDDATSPADFHFASAGATVRTLFRNERIPCTLVIPDGQRPRYVSLKSIDWIGPILFISASLASDNGAAVSIALGVISNYLTDFFKGMGHAPKVKLSFVVETTQSGTYKKLVYEGDVAGLAALTPAIRAVSDE